MSSANPKGPKQVKKINENLKIFQSKSLVSKLNTLESKYNEFVQNCSTLMQSQNSPRSSKKNVQHPKIPAKRVQSTDLSRENQKLKRQIEVLTNTIEELDKKVTMQEKIKDEYSAAKELDKILKGKNLLLEKQEQDLIQLKKELQRSKLEFQTMKDPRNEKVKREKLATSNGMKNSKSPLSQRWVPKQREYSPIERKVSVSPINRNISPRDRLNHGLKKQVRSLQEDLEKIKEERDLYKAWQQVVSENPPLPPAIESIINKYESELSALSMLNDLQKKTLEKLAKQTKDYMTESTKPFSDKEKHLELLESKKRKILQTIVESSEFHKPKPPAPETPCRPPEESVSRLKLTHTRLIKEYEDLEKIMKREQNRADLAFFELNIKTAEIFELKRGLESAKHMSSSAHVTTDHFFDSKNFTSPETFTFGPEDSKRKFVETEELEEWKDQVFSAEGRISAEFKRVWVKFDEFSERFVEQYKRMGQVVQGFKGKNEENSEKFKRWQRDEEELRARVKVLEGYKGRFEQVSEDWQESERKVVRMQEEVVELGEKLRSEEEIKKELGKRVGEEQDKVRVLSESLRTMQDKVNSLGNLESSQEFFNKSLDDFLSKVNSMYQKTFTPTTLDELSVFLIDKNQSLLYLQSRILETEENLQKNLKTVKDLTQDLVNKEKVIEQNRKDLESLTEKMQEKEKTIETYSNNLKTLSQEVSKNTEVQETSLKSCQVLTEQLEVKENALQQLSKSLQDLNEKLKITEEELLKSSKSLEPLIQKSTEQEHQLKDYSESNKQLTDKLAQASNELKEKSSKLLSTEEDLSSLQVFYDSIYNEKIKLIEDLHAAQESQKTIQSLLLSEQVLSESLKADLELAQKSSKDSSTKSQELEHKLDFLQKTIKNLREEADSRSLSEQNLIDEKNNEIAILKSDAQNLENLVEKLEKQLSSASQEKQEALKKSEQSQKLLDDIQDLKGIIKTYESTSAKMEKEIENYQGIIGMVKHPKLDLCSEYSENIQSVRNKAQKVVSPHSIMRTESLEEMPEIVLDEEKILSDKSSQDKNSIEATQLSLLSQIQETYSESPPDLIVNWCKKVLGSDNYILRYQSSGSMYSEESKSNFDEVSVVSESNQELNYRAHAKLMQQKKIIESLIAKNKDKKEKMKLCKLNIKTLQNEIRNLDNKLKNSEGIDIEYLKTSIASFSKNLKNIDNDSLKVLQVIHSQLGIKMESIGQKKWSFFNKK